MNKETDKETNQEEKISETEILGKAQGMGKACGPETVSGGADEEGRGRQERKERPKREEETGRAGGKNGRKRFWFCRGVKIPVMALHVVCASVLIFCFLASVSGRFSIRDVWSVGKTEEFTESRSFTNGMLSETQNVLRYSWLKMILETDGKLDMSKEILKVKEEGGEIRTYRLDEIITAEIGGGYGTKPFFSGGYYGGTVTEYSWSGYGTASQSVFEGDVLVQGAGAETESAGMEYKIEDSYDDSDETILEVTWFACDRSFSPDPDKAGGSVFRYRKENIGWMTSDLVNEYQGLKAYYEGDHHNFYFAMSGKRELENGKSREEIRAMGKYYIITRTSAGYEVETNLTGIVNSEDGSYHSYNSYNRYGGRNGYRYGSSVNAEDYYVLDEEGDQLYVGMDTAFPAADDYRWQQEQWQSQRVFAKRLLVCIPVCAVNFLLTFLYLLVAAGKTGKRDRNIRLCFFDRIPFEILMLGLLLMLVWWYGVISSYRNSYRYDYAETAAVAGNLLPGLYLNDGWTALVLTGGILLLEYGFCLAVLLRLIRRKRYGESCSVLWHAAKWAFGTGREQLQLSLQVGVLSVLGSFLAALFAFFSGVKTAEGHGYGLLFFAVLLFLLLFISAFFIRKAVERKKLMESVRRIAVGEITYQIPEERFSGADRRLAGDINHIRDGLETAVEEAMKNERMKTELISNVSHDIKTPLTSIINYADLLKRELSGGRSDSEEGKERVLQYLDVLDQKGKRLKVLTEDLVEASKASSGTLQLNPERINLVELAAQVNGEFEERFRERRLSLVPELSAEPLFILADGRRMWRVLENLYQNVYKYALEGTRVYVQVRREAAGKGQDPNGAKENGGMLAVFDIKNISAEPLRMSAEELTERFVRGDVARSSEGSGLGLSIAKSLAELQGGAFRITVDGDLFRVTVEFPAVPAGAGSVPEP